MAGSQLIKYYGERHFDMLAALTDSPHTTPLKLEKETQSQFHMIGPQGHTVCSIDPS